MTLSTNDDFANRELSIEELEAIAAGGLWGWIKHEASVIYHDVSVVVHFVEGLKSHQPTFPRGPTPVDA